jgi:hypothetical protein
MSTQFSGPTTTAAQGLYDVSSVQNHVIGETIFTNDGRMFRYCKAGGTTLVSGKLQQAPAEDTTNMQALAVAASAIGATSVTTTTTVTLTSNQVAGGFLVVTQTPGLGKVYRIKSHAAATAAVVTFNLEDSIQVALTTASQIDVIPNPYDGVIVNPASASSAPIGCAVAPITNAQFGWLQVGGVAPVLADGTVTVGTAVVASNGVAGAVEALTGVQAPVGIALTGIATTDYGLIKLQL